MRIGVDFDNTIVCYDAVFRTRAQARGLLPADWAGSREELRAAIRALPEGETRWQELQGWVYGAGMPEATPFPGVLEALADMTAAGHTLTIVSHKTRYGHFDPARIDLREAALAWMARHGLFDPAGIGLARERVFFESTRAEKVRRIAELELDLFVDDLPEVFETPGFPAEVTPILFGSAAGPWTPLPAWPAIRQEVLG
jgi:hypothetical protein